MVTGNFVASLREAGAKGRASGSPISIAVDSNGNVYIASSSGQIQRFDAKSKDVTVVAGGDRGTPGRRKGDGEHDRPILNSPGEVVLDSKGNLIVADTGNNRIRYIDLEKNSVGTLPGN